MSRLAQLIESRYGFNIREEFPPKPIILATDTAKIILKANPDRVDWIIFNLGTTVVYLAHTSPPSSTKGYYLDKNGGNINMNWEEDGELVGYQIYAISSGTPTLFVKAVVGT